MSHMNVFRLVPLPRCHDDDGSCSADCDGVGCWLAVGALSAQLDLADDFTPLPARRH